MSTPTEVTVCDECGAQVADKAKHTTWHEQVITNARLVKVVDMMAQQSEYNQ